MPFDAKPYRLTLDGAITAAGFDATCDLSTIVAVGKTAAPSQYPAIHTARNPALCEFIEQLRYIS